MVADFPITPFEGDWAELVQFVELSAGFTPHGAARLLEIEKTRGTAYFVAKDGEKLVGAVGIYIDPVPEVRKLEPALIIDLAVMPEYHRRGIGRALVEVAANHTKAQGERYMWLFTDGQSERHLSTYVGMGFLLAGVLPCFNGPGTCRAYFMRDLGE